jgi:hypothetical protein
MDGWKDGWMDGWMDGFRFHGGFGRTGISHTFLCGPWHAHTHSHPIHI